ncbi:MAG: Gfo/Idh/MocA family oxidoreductase [Armatimonadaceae bacterium]
MSEKTEDEYSLKAGTSTMVVAAPEVPYRPRDPQEYRPKIGIIGCGGISQTHLRAYRSAGYDVVMLCDLHPERLEARQKEFYPDADVTTEFHRVLEREEIKVVDIATHPPERLPLIEAALRAKKHVLSQKPFVTDLDEGGRLVALADEMGVRLAVNQNGRWSPHFAYMREAVRAGHIGDVLSVHLGVHWDHSWVKGTPFEEIYDLILYDFGIHWFDFMCTIIGERPITRVQASRSFATGQAIAAPMLAQAVVEFEGGQGSLVLDGFLKYGAQDRTYIGGTKGSLRSDGPNLGEQTVTVYTEQGTAIPQLSGAWFPDGFHGTMGELLCAVEENREPTNSARNNLKSLALCFAAIAAAGDSAPKIPGEVRKLPM